MQMFLKVNKENNPPKKQDLLGNKSEISFFYYQIAKHIHLFIKRKNDFYTFKCMPPMTVFLLMGAVL